MTYLMLLSGLSLAVLALLVWRAPRGWQDEDGFHLGDEPYEGIGVAVPEKSRLDQPPVAGRDRKAA